MRGLQQVHLDHEADGIIVLSVLILDKAGDQVTVDDAVAWREELGLTFDTLVDETGDFTARWNPEERVPMGYVFDREGNVVFQETGSANAAEELEQAALDVR